MTAELVQPRRTILSRGDLVAAFSTGDANLVDSVASQLGLQYVPPEPSLPLPKEMSHPVHAPTDASAKIAAVDDSTDVSLWMVTSYESLAPRPPQNEKDAESYVHWNQRPKKLPACKPLAPWTTLRTRIHRSLTNLLLGRRVDIPRLVRQVARRELVQRVPRLKRRRWDEGLFVVQDRSMRLVPFEHDQLVVIRELKKLLPAKSVRVLIGDHPQCLTLDRPEEKSIEDNEIRFDSPAPGSQVLVLGDLGALARSRRAVQTWFRWGRWLRQRGCHLSALVPCSLKRIPKRLRQVFNIESWQLDAGALVQDEESRARFLLELFTLASPAIRVEPGLLRDLRRLLSRANDASLEVDFWLSNRLLSNHPTAATIDSETANDQLRPRFNNMVPAALQKKVLHCIRSWHARLTSSPEIWFEELLCLPSELQEMVPKQDLADARAAVRAIIQRSEDHQQENWESSEAFVSRQTDRITQSALQDNEVGHLWHRARQKHHRRFATRLDLAVEMEEDVAKIYPASNIKNCSHVVANIASMDGRVKLEIDDRFWKTSKPDFVVDYGTDEYGAWFEFEVRRRSSKPNFGQSVAGVERSEPPAEHLGAHFVRPQPPDSKLETASNRSDKFVRQRMRWISAGTFLMGSPDDEPERWDDEVQHEVTITKGFWMADTACTQALWKSVMASNPSRFVGRQKPVEKISYEDASKFIDHCNETVVGLNLRFPTEAEWEYACRAGTTTAFHTGNQLTTDDANYDGRYPYTDGAKGEYRGETVACKSFRPNAWGLYEMHGNVWEWCKDWKGGYDTNNVIDPLGPTSGSYRVVRGGSWNSDARSLRSAYRYAIEPVDRWSLVGFRCVSSGVAEPTVFAKVPVAEQGPQRTRVGGAEKNFRAPVQANARESGATLPLYQSDAYYIQTDLGRIQLRRQQKPPWAVEFGQDAFGTYADFEVSRRSDDSKIRQRLRWIPPGQFKMGSPETEPGHYGNETQHDVDITLGFWMLETPVTQNLWMAISNENNPSCFADPSRPVEQVLWQEAKDFTSQLGKHVGIQFRLPTEAEWEYACRGGTQTAIYTGNLEIIADANAPALDPIAWYGGNCGLDLGREDGIEVTWLANKQYQFERGATRRVREKAPNPWGLYDMLGNVGEWCSDWWDQYNADEYIDPQGPADGSDRVVRGGSWGSDARYVRSACRDASDPGDRWVLVGFRCVSSASQASAERVSASRA